MITLARASRRSVGEALRDVQHRILQNLRPRRSSPTAAGNPQRGPPARPLLLPQRIAVIKHERITCVASGNFGNGAGTRWELRRVRQCRRSARCCRRRATPAAMRGRPAKPPDRRRARGEPDAVQAACPVRGRPGTDRPECRHRALGRPHLGLTCVDAVRRRVQQDTLQTPRLRRRPAVPHLRRAGRRGPGGVPRLGVRMDLPAKRGHDESMAIAMGRQFSSLLPELRCEPTTKRVRVLLDGMVVRHHVGSIDLGAEAGRAVLRGAGSRITSASVESAAGAGHRGRAPGRPGGGPEPCSTRATGFARTPHPGQP